MYKLEDYAEVIQKCSHCGFCQATCPVYLHDLAESHVARSRLNLINQTMVKKTIPVTERTKEIIDRCLLCTNCAQTCPPRIPIDEIIAAARSELGTTGMGSVRKTVINKMLTQRGVAGLLGKAASWAQKLGLGGTDMPPLASRSFDKMYSGEIPARHQGQKRGRVAYFVGCGTNFMYPDTGEATVKVLIHSGYDVIIPSGQVCCGIPLLTEGDLAGARSMLESNVKLFAGLDNVDAIITDCTSCGMMWKEKYARLAAADDPLQAQIGELGAKIFEITDFLVSRGLPQVPGSMNGTYTYHVPCHRGWTPTVKDAPQNLLRQIPDLEYQPLENPEKCCGAGGMFYLQHKELAEEIRQQRLEEVRQTGVKTLITQCPICRFYLSANNGVEETVHPITLLARSYGL